MKHFAATTCAALLVAAALSTPAHAGVHYRATTTSEGARGAAQSMEVEAWVDGPNAKILFANSDNPMLGTGTYIISNDGGETLFLVNPEEKTYSQLDLGALMAGAGAMLKAMGPMMKISFSNQKVEKLAEEPGPAILGYATTHYKFHTSYDSSIKVMGMGQSSHNDSTTDTWTTTELSDAGFGAWLRREPRTGIEDLDNMIAAEVSKGIHGVPLKMASATTTKDQRGNETKTDTTMEVTALKQESVAAGTFAIPKEFERTELAPAMPGRP